MCSVNLRYIIGGKLSTTEVCASGILECVSLYMAEIIHICDLLGLSEGIKYYTRQVPDGEVLGTTIGSSDRIKLGVDEGPDMVSSDDSFDGINHGNIYSSVYV